MIKIRKTDAGFVVDGRNLIKQISVGSDRFRCHRWFKNNVYGYAVHGFDFFVVPLVEETRKAQQGRPAPDIFFSLDFSISVCLLIKTEKAIKLRNYLIDYKNGIEKKQRGCDACREQEGF